MTTPGLHACYGAGQQGVHVWNGWAPACTISGEQLQQMLTFGSEMHPGWAVLHFRRKAYLLINHTLTTCAMAGHPTQDTPASNVGSPTSCSTFCGAHRQTCGACLMCPLAWQPRTSGSTVRLAQPRSQQQASRSRSRHAQSMMAAPQNCTRQPLPPSACMNRGCHPCRTINLYCLSSKDKPLPDQFLLPCCQALLNTGTPHSCSSMQAL